MAEIIIKEHVITSYMAKITYVVAEITLKVVVVTSSVAKIIFVLDETTFKVAVITFQLAIICDIDSYNSKIISWNWRHKFP